MISLEKQKLLNNMKFLCQCIPIKSTMPILENICFSSIDGKLKMSSTDLESSVEIITDLEFDEDPFLLPGIKLFNIIKQLDSEFVYIEKEDEKMFYNVTSGEDEFKLLYMSNEEFPELSIDKDYILNFDIKSEILQPMLKKIKFACSSEDSRFTTNTFCFEIDATFFKITATDGKRLAHVNIESNFKFNKDLVNEIKVLIPNNNLIIEFCNRHDLINLTIYRNRILLSSNKETLIIRTIEGNFPPYEKALQINLSKRNDIEINVEKKSLLSALKKSYVLTTQDSKSVKIKTDKNNIIFYTVDPNIGESRIILKIEKEIKSFDRCFNPEFIVDVINNIEDKKIELKFKSEMGPLILESKYKECKFSYIIMPLEF